MRILIISNSYLPENNGTAIRTASLVRSLLKLNQEVNIGTIYPQTPQLFRMGDDVSDCKNFDNIFIRRFQSQLELTFGMFILNFKRKFDVIHARGPRCGLIAWVLHILYKTPYIVELNYFLPQKNQIKDLLLKQVLKSSSRLIVLSDYATHWAESTLGIPKNRIDVVKNVIDADIFKPSSNKSIKEELGIKNEIVVGYAGTFFEWQGVFNFVEVANQVIKARKDVKFLMVGDGPDYKKTSELIDDCGLSEYFILTGNVPYDEVKCYLDVMDIVLIARTRDILNQISIPLKVLEAMSMEKVVVATNVKGLEEVITNKITGIIVDSNPKSISERILELIDDLSLRLSIGRAARNEILLKYQEDVQGKLLLDSYKKAV